MTKPQPKLKITGEHISTDGKNKCIHYSDGVVVIEPIKEDIICKRCGLEHIKGSREATRDFVFGDICISCNKKENE